MSPVSPGAGRALPANYKWIVLCNTKDFRRATEEVLLQQAATGSG